MRLIGKRISLLKQNVDTTNTVKDNKAAAKLLRSHLKEKNMETTFKMFDVATLVETLHIFSLVQKGEIFTKPQL
jgi:triacylglycerol esterase/lipase EstA (alpha/beta hydrolase family)